MYLLANQGKSILRNAGGNITAMIDFKIEDDLGGYDKKLNPNMLSVKDLLPKRVSWLHDGKKIEIIGDNGIIPILLVDNKGVALIKAPFDIDKNQACIYDAEGDMIWNIKDIGNEKIKKPCSMMFIIFWMSFAFLLISVGGIIGFLLTLILELLGL